MNLRPPGYEPDELPTALPCVVVSNIRQIALGVKSVSRVRVERMPDGVSGRFIPASLDNPLFSEDNE